MGFKRKESQVIMACLQYLRILQNQGNILWFGRINSGTAFVKGRKIELCPAGTADILFFNNNHTVWIETKIEGSKLSEVQLMFKDKVVAANHKYVIVREINHLDRLWKTLRYDI